MLENTVQSFSLGNLIHSHSFNSYLYMLKLSPVQSWHLSCNFLLDRSTWMPHRPLKLNRCKRELIIFLLPLPNPALPPVLPTHLSSGFTTRVFTQVGNVGMTMALLVLIHYA